MGIRLGIGGLKIGQRSGTAAVPFDWSSYWATLISATVENAAPTHVVLTFPAAQTSLVASDFTVTGFTISSASWTGAVLTLVLSTPVLVFDGNLTITFKTGQEGTITNNVADDGNTVAWYDYSDQSTITKDGNNKVSIWWEKLVKNSVLGVEENSGNLVIYGIYQITATQAGYFYAGCAVGDIFPCNEVRALDANNKVKRYAGNHLGQRIIATQGTWTPDGVLFDGIGERMATAIFDYPQPATIYLLFNQKTWTQYDKIVNFASGDYGLNQAQTSPRMRFSLGGSSSDSANSNLTIDTFGIVKIICNGASSSLQVNDQPAITGNFGTNPLNGISLADMYLGSGVRNGNICYKQLIFREGVDDAGTLTAIDAVLKKNFE